MRLLLLTCLLATTGLAAACSGSDDPEPTQASFATRPGSIPTATAPATLAATPSATATTPASPTPAAAAPTATATTAPATGGSTNPPPPPPPPRATNVSLRLVADNVAFDQARVTVPAGATVTATMQNNDEGIEHNLTFGLPGLPHGDTCTGPCTQTQTFQANTAGSYFFLCTIHDMSGAFIVE